MARVSDENVLEIATRDDVDVDDRILFETAQDLALDLRDARALLRMAAEFVEDCDDSDARRRRGPDMLERIRQHLEGEE